MDLKDNKIKKVRDRKKVKGREAKISNFFGLK